jgi:hypothetical protein
MKDNHDHNFTAHQNSSKSLINAKSMSSLVLVILTLVFSTEFAFSLCYRDLWEGQWVPTSETTGIANINIVGECYDQQFCDPECRLVGNPTAIYVQEYCPEGLCNWGPANDAYESSQWAYGHWSFLNKEIWLYAEPSIRLPRRHDLYVEILTFYRDGRMPPFEWKSGYFQHPSSIEHVQPTLEGSNQ